MAINQPRVDQLEADSQDLILNSGRTLIRSPYIMEHFCGGGVAINSWAPKIFTCTETGAATPFALGATGDTVAIGVTGGTTNNAQEIAGTLVGWKPSTMATKAKLVFEMRAKFVGATEPLDGDMYFGFGDAVTYTNSLPYVVSAASALTTHVPTEFVGFAYSSIATSGALFLTGGNHWGFVSSKASVDTVTAPSVSVVKSSVFRTFRIELDSSSNAAFFIDGQHVGSVAAATTATVALTPYVNMVAKASHTNTGTIDYIFVGGDVV
jgi:hypothetical protein